MLKSRLQPQLLGPALLISAIGLVPPALGQTPNPAAKPDPAALGAKMEASKRVLDAKGQLIAPWTQKHVCPLKDSKQGCMLAIVNMETGEIAKVGDTWSTAFEPSGDGKEMQRSIFHSTTNRSDKEDAKKLTARRVRFATPKDGSSASKSLQNSASSPFELKSARAAFWRYSLRRHLRTQHEYGRY